MPTYPMTVRTPPGQANLHLRVWEVHSQTHPRNVHYVLMGNAMSKRHIKTRQVHVGPYTWTIDYHSRYNTIPTTPIGCTCLHWTYRGVHAEVDSYETHERKTRPGTYFTDGEIIAQDGCKHMFAVQDHLTLMWATRDQAQQEAPPLRRSSRMRNRR